MSGRVWVPSYRKQMNVYKVCISVDKVSDTDHWGDRPRGTWTKPTNKHKKGDLTPVQNIITFLSVIYPFYHLY